MNTKIAFRFISRNIIQSLSIFFAVFIGVAAMFFIFTIGTSLEDMILEQSTAYQAHVIVEYTHYKVLPSEVDHSRIEKLLNDNPEITFTTYRTSFYGSISNEKGLNTAFTVLASPKGTKYLDAYGVSDPKNLRTGRLSDPDKNEIMLEDYFAKENNIKAGDTVTFTANHISHELLVTGTFDLGLIRPTRNYAYLNLELFVENKVKRSFSLVIQVSDPMNPEITATKLNDYLGTSEYSEIITWKDLNPDANLLNVAQIAVVLVIDIFILLAVFIVVISMLNFSIKQKYKQLGILKTMGTTNSNITKIFTIQTLLLSIPGLVLGLLAGTVMMKMYHNYMVYPDGTHRFNLIFLPINYMWSIVTVILTILLATILSMRRLQKNTIIQMIKT